MCIRFLCACALVCMGSFSSWQPLAAEEQVSPVERYDRYVNEYPFSVVEGGRTGSTHGVPFAQRMGWDAESLFGDPDALEIAKAVQEDNIGVLNAMLDKGFDIDHRGQGGMTFLLFSLAFRGDATRRLLERGADPFVLSDPPGPSTAAEVLIGFGPPEYLELLLGRGMSANRYCPATGSPMIRLAFPNADNFERLVEAGAEVNLRRINRGDCKERFAAPTTASLRTISLFLKSGGDFRECSLVARGEAGYGRGGNAELAPNLLLLFGQGALEGNRCFSWELSRQEEWTDINRWFLEECAVNTSTVWGDFVACRRRYGAPSQPLRFNDATLVAPTTILAIAAAGEWLPDKGSRAEQVFSSPDAIALVQAIEADDHEEIRRLVESGADVDATGRGGVSPLIWSTQSDFDTFALLLELGANPDAPLSKVFYPVPSQYLEAGDTALHWACRYGTIRHVDVLLSHGADINAQRTHCGRSPLFDLIELGSSGDFAHLVRGTVLGVDTYVDTRAHGYLNQSTSAYSHIPTFDLERFRAFQNQCPVPTRHSYQLEAIERLAGHDEIDLDVQDVHGRTALMAAAATDQPGALFMGMLLLHGAGTRFIDETGYDVVLQMIRAKRRALPIGLPANAAQEAEVRWRRAYTIPITAIECRGGDFALAERTVWKDDGPQPSVNLKEIPLEKRPWLPSAGGVPR